MKIENKYNFNTNQRGLYFSPWENYHNGRRCYIFARTSSILYSIKIDASKCHFLASNGQVMACEMNSRELSIFGSADKCFTAQFRSGSSPICSVSHKSVIHNVTNSISIPIMAFILYFGFTLIFIYKNHQCNVYKEHFGYSSMQSLIKQFD